MLRMLSAEMDSLHCGSCLIKPNVETVTVKQHICNVTLVDNLNMYWSQSNTAWSILHVVFEIWNEIVEWFQWLSVKIMF